MCRNRSRGFKSGTPGKPQTRSGEENDKRPAVTYAKKKQFRLQILILTSTAVDGSHQLFLHVDGSHQDDSSNERHPDAGPEPNAGTTTQRGRKTTTAATRATETAIPTESSVAISQRAEDTINCPKTNLRYSKGTALSRLCPKESHVRSQQTRMSFFVALHGRLLRHLLGGRDHRLPVSLIFSMHNA